MSEVPGRASRRANWVGLRTLRQMPNVVGTTKDGETIYEVHSVRLVLRSNATHFTRILACSKCGRDVLGTPVLTVGDLDHTASSVICKECVRIAPGPTADRVARRAATMPQPAPAPARMPPTLTDPAGTTNGAQAVPAASPGPVNGDAPASPAEARLSDLVAAGAELRSALGNELAGLGDFQALEQLVEERVGRRLTEMLEARGRQMAAALEGRLREVQAVVDRLTAAAEERDRSQARLDMRLKGLADQAAQAAHADSERSREAELDTLQAALDAVRSEATTAAASAAAGGERLAAVEDRVLGLPDAIAELAGIQEQMSLRLDVLAERVARPAVEDEGRLEALERRLRDDLAARQTEIGRAVAAVAAVAEAGTRRVDSVEERIGRSGDELSEVTELQAALDEGLGELRAQLADLDEQEADATAGVMARVEALERRVEESLRGRRAPAGATLAQDSRLSRTFGRASAEVAAELSALSEAAGSLVWRHDQLEMRMGMVEQARDEATRSVQGQLAALHKQLTAQHQALLALTETVEGLRPKKAAGRTTKATKATKGPKV